MEEFDTPMLIAIQDDHHQVKMIDMMMMMIMMMNIKEFDTLMLITIYKMTTISRDD